MLRQGSRAAAGIAGSQQEFAELRPFDRMTAPGPGIIALASNGGAGPQPPQILIGYADYQSSANNVSATSQVHLSLAHAGPVTPSNTSGSVGLRVEHIPNSDLAVLSQIEFMEDLTVPLSSGAGTAILPPLPVGEVFRVTLLATQSISFAPISNLLLGSAPFSVNAAADSGLAVGVMSNTPTVCTISGVTLTLLAAGECSLTASQAGNTSYTAATPVTRAFFVTTACDINQDGEVTVADVQLLVSEVLGAAPAIHDMNQDGLVNVVDVQILMDIAQGLSCKI